MKLKLDLNAMRVESFDAGPGGFAVMELLTDRSRCTECGETCEAKCYVEAVGFVNVVSDGSPRDTLCYHDTDGASCNNPVCFNNTARDCRSRKGCHENTYYTHYCTGDC
jgi:hypothetical protein